MRMLDTGRPYGQIIPRVGQAAFEQDHLQFDVAGRCIGDPPEPEQSEPNHGPATNGAVSLSEPVSAPRAPRTVAVDDGFLSPKSAAEWETAHWHKLRKALKDTFDQWPKNRTAALAILQQHNLITGV